jgi:hypothetical protein
MAYFYNHPVAAALTLVAAAYAIGAAAILGNGHRTWKRPSGAPDGGLKP